MKKGLTEFYDSLNSTYMLKIKKRVKKRFKVKAFDVNMQTL